MSEKIYLQFLILCVIFREGIIATLSEADSRESSDFHVRNKRVISQLPDRGPTIPIERANYMVTIKDNNIANCAGVILSHYSVLTAAVCVIVDISRLEIFSGSGYDFRSNTHTVTSKTIYYGNPPHGRIDGIAVISVDPPFVFDQRTGILQLYQGPLPDGTRVTVFGWGCNYPPRPSSYPRRRLRSITVSIINHRECQNSYRIVNRNVSPVTEKHICTYDPQQYCARADVGAPLIINNKIAGIHVWKGEFENHVNPEVFVDLRRHDYSTWIRENTLLI